MNWDRKTVFVPCGGKNCVTPVKVTTQQQSDAIIALGKNPLCERCFKAGRPKDCLAPVSILEW